MRSSIPPARVQLGITLCSVDQRQYVYRLTDVWRKLAMPCTGAMQYFWPLAGKVRTPGNWSWWLQFNGFGRKMIGG